MKYEDVFSPELKAALDRGDQEAVDREWPKWIAKLEAIAAENPAFAKWFDKFCKDQERLMRWADVIGDGKD